MHTIRTQLFFLFTCTDTFWIIIVARVVEGTPESNVLPCLSRFTCVQSGSLAIYREKLRFSKSKLTSDERIYTSVIELAAADSSETNKNTSKAAAENPLSTISWEKTVPGNFKYQIYLKNFFFLETKDVSIVSRYFLFVRHEKNVLLVCIYKHIYMNIYYTYLYIFVLVLLISYLYF